MLIEDGCWQPSWFFFTVIFIHNFCIARPTKQVISGFNISADQNVWQLHEFQMAIGGHLKFQPSEAFPRCPPWIFELSAMFWNFVYAVQHCITKFPTNYYFRHIDTDSPTHIVISLKLFWDLQTYTFLENQCFRFAGCMFGGHFGS